MSNIDTLGYDADHSDPSQYCRHGTFIGSWWGPDYLCGWCETGEEPPTAAEQAAYEAARAAEEAADFDQFTAQLQDALRPCHVPYHQIAAALFDYAEHSAFRHARKVYS